MATMLHDSGTPGTKDASRPMRDLLLQMPHLQLDFEYEIDYESADPALLRQIGENADTAMRTIHLGLAAVGQLLVRASPEIELREISADVTEALGWLIAELGDFAATAHCLAAACQRHTADYKPKSPERFPNART